MASPTPEPVSKSPESSPSKLNGNISDAKIAEDRNESPVPSDDDPILGNSDDNDDDDLEMADLETQEPEKSKDQTHESDKDDADDDKANEEEGEDVNVSVSEETKDDADVEPLSVSQLDIDDSKIVSDAEGDMEGDTEMADTTLAPSPLKATRERDDEPSEDEPAAKRTKTEQSEDPDTSIVASTPVAPSAPAPVKGDGASALKKIFRWEDEDLLSSPITPYRAREYRRILAGAKKTKNGIHFKDAVVKLWPALQEAYLARVEKPMDIGILERTLRDTPWDTVRDFRDNLSLLYLNAVSFNGEVHEVAQAGFAVVDIVWTKGLSVGSEEPPRPKPIPKQIPSRHEQRVAAAAAAAAAAAPPSTPSSHGANNPTSNTSHTPASGSAASPKSKVKQSASARRTSTTAISPLDKSAADTYAVPPNGVPLIRRASTHQDGDRPKRTIHPPKSKDIDYTKGGKKRHAKPELDFCEEVLVELRSPRNYVYNAPFLQPVDPVALDIPDYFHIIKKPMDMGTIATKLDRGEYTNAKQFQADMDLMFRNCYTFNAPGTPVHNTGKALERMFKTEFGKKDEWLAKHAAAAKAASAAAEVFSDEEDVEEVDVAAGASSSSAAVGGSDPALSQTISALEEKLMEETNKLTKLYMQPHPNESMITLQQSMVTIVQQSLLAEKRKVPPGKSDKKRPAKSSKTKSNATASSASNKKSSSSATGSAIGSNATKKSSGPKKPSKKSINENEKNLIANGINDLESPHIDQAIAIIKKDTNQTENPNGELELDIDQLSMDALLRLWDVCKKAIPNFGRDRAYSDDEPGSPGYGNPPTSATSSKPKKSKPMSAKEQEERIAMLSAQLSRARGQANGAGSPGAMSLTALSPEPDSDESDSEEE